MYNSRVPPVYSLVIFDPLPQQAVKEGKDFDLGLGGRHLVPYGWNLIVNRYASDMEGFWVGIEVNYVRVGLRNDQDKGGVWADLEEGRNKLI